MDKDINALCYWCGNLTGETVTIKYEDWVEYACGTDTDEFVISYEPCGECQAKWASGDVVLFEVLTEALPGHFNTPIITQNDVNYFATGRYAVVKESWVRENIGPEIAERALKNKIMFIGPEVFEELFMAPQDPEVED